VLEGVALNPRLNQADALHPNAAGAKIIADRIFPKVRALVAQARHVPVKAN
jgi:acyl-CoA thioesterase-1